jgi:hypothetical protein
VQRGGDEVEDLCREKGAGLRTCAEGRGTGGGWDVVDDQ